MIHILSNCTGFCGYLLDKFHCGVNKYRCMWIQWTFLCSFHSFIFLKNWYFSFGSFVQIFALFLFSEEVPRRYLWCYWPTLCSFHYSSNVIYTGDLQSYFVWIALFGLNCGQIFSYFLRRNGYYCWMAVKDSWKCWFHCQCFVYWKSRFIGLWSDSTTDWWSSQNYILMWNNVKLSW